MLELLDTSGSAYLRGNAKQIQAPYIATRKAKDVDNNLIWQRQLYRKVYMGSFHSSLAVSRVPRLFDSVIAIEVSERFSYLSSSS